MRNRFVETFNVRYPLISAGMAMIAVPELVAAVSNAGAIGTLGTGPVPPEWLKQAVHDVRSRTVKPFAVNLINETTAFGPLTTDAHVDVCVEEKVELVIFFWQLPESSWVQKLDNAGIPFIVTAGTADAVDRAVDLPLSGLMLQGMEAGGHVRSEASLQKLLRQTREKHPEQMLIGAGGIADAGDVKRALDWGADAVCLGTRFVASAEANAHAEYQQRIISACGSDTVVTEIFGPEWPGVPMRVIANEATRGVAAGQSIGNTDLLGHPYEMPPNSAVLPMRGTTGNFDMMCLAAGKSVEGIHDVLPAAEIVRSLFPDW